MSRVHVFTDYRADSVMCAADITPDTLGVLVSDVEESDCQDCRSLVAKCRDNSRLTRQERLQGLADSGCDTWEEYRGER